MWVKKTVPWIDKVMNMYWGLFWGRNTKIQDYPFDTIRAYRYIYTQFSPSGSNKVPSEYSLCDLCLEIKLKM